MSWCNASTTPRPVVSAYPCLNASTGHLPLPLPWDPPPRQVPLFILWEQYASYLPHGLTDVAFIQIGAKCVTERVLDSSQ